jgi:hypothetical protein
MALEYVTGRDLSLTINSVTYNDVAASVVLSTETNQQVLEVLSGRAYKTIDQTATLTVELYQDWGSTTPASVCEALWTATSSAPDTGIQFSFDSNGAVFTGEVMPMYPDSGGAATDALTVTVELMVVDGNVLLND